MRHRRRGFGNGMTTIDPAMLSGRPVEAGPRDPNMLAHDVRGALQGIHGGVAALGRMELAAEAREQVDRIAAASRILHCLIAGLVGLDAAPYARQGEPVQLRRLLRHIARRWSGEAREAGVRFDLRVEDAAPDRLDVDLVAIVRTLGNLIGNAIRHGDGGDIRLDARAAPGGGLVLTVRDDGPGLDPGVVERLRSAEFIAPEGGHGLGLRIVDRLCAEMGATFELRPATGGGTEARVTLPASLCAEGADEAPPSPKADSPCDLGGVRILLAEDNPTNQIVATEMLGALNARVTLASDGIEAMERFEAAAFDLVVVDIEMPRMTGLDVIRTIRGRRDGRAGVPIVALTAYAMHEHRERIAAAGANGLISKPITSIEALGTALRAHLKTDAAPAPAPAAGAAPVAAPPAPARDAAGPVADLAVFDALCAAIGEGMMAELLEKVVADLAQAKADLDRARDPLDRKAIRSASHILISVAGAIGAVRLQACARDLNAAAHGDATAPLDADVLRCLAEIEAAIAFADGRRATA